MALNTNNLSVLADANGFTLWHYTTPDFSTEVNASYYFDGASHMLRSGDMILVNTNVGTDHSRGCLIMVTAIDAGRVFKTNLTK